MSNITNVNCKKLYDNATLPTEGSPYSAGQDLHAYLESSEITIEPHETKLIGTGLAMEIPEGMFGGIYARSGLSTKEGLRPANCVGVIDADYRGEIKVPIHNDTNHPRTITNDERIAQIIIQEFVKVQYNVVDQLNDTVRGTGGFGSTGA